MYRSTLPIDPTPLVFLGWQLEALLALVASMSNVPSLFHGHETQPFQHLTLFHMSREKERFEVGFYVSVDIGPNKMQIANGAANLREYILFM